jgi:hypothetical protein
LGVGWIRRRSKLKIFTEHGIERVIAMQWKGTITNFWRKRQNFTWVTPREDTCPVRPRFSQHHGGSKRTALLQAKQTNDGNLKLRTSNGH